MKTPKRRIEELEENKPTTSEHKYLMVIRLNEFDRLETKYFKDDEPISRAEYERDAPKKPGKINIHWREVDGDENNSKAS